MSTGQETKPTDSRDMYAVHIMFRREFGALRSLIRGVAAGDRNRTRTVADHVALMTDLVHAHHGGEDSHCWPKLEARAPQDVAPLTELMKTQHQAIAAGLEDVDRKTEAWRSSAAEPDRDALAEAVQEVMGPLGEHLETEEQNLLPLVDRYLTVDEWAAVGNQGLANVSRSKIPLLFGMLLEDASPVHWQLYRESLPTPLFAVMSRLGPVVYHRYQRKLYPKTPQPR